MGREGSRALSTSLQISITDSGNQSSHGIAAKAEDGNQNFPGKDTGGGVAGHRFPVEAVSAHLSADAAVFPIGSGAKRTENFPDEDISKVFQGIGIICFPQGGESAALFQSIPDSLQQPDMVIMQLRIESMGGRVSVNIVEIDCSGDVGTGVGLQLIFQVEKEIFSDSDIRRESDGISVQNAFSVGSPTGSPEIGAAARNQGTGYQDAFDEPKHFVALPAVCLCSCIFRVPAGCLCVCGGRSGDMM